MQRMWNSDTRRPGGLRSPLVSPPRRTPMSRRQIVLIFLVVAVVLTLRGRVTEARASSQGNTAVLDPANFVAVVDNPYFPLPVGRTLVYEGIKDGQTQIDTVTVTAEKKVILG